MIAETEIRRIAEKLGRAINAYKVVLFGSHARGQAREGSDVDFLLVADSDLPRFKRSRELYRILNPYPFGMDLLVYTPKEVHDALKSPLSFVSTAMKEGKVVYAR